MAKTCVSMRLPACLSVSLPACRPVARLSVCLWCVCVHSVAGVPATMILSEVIPFLVLAIGVDNVFLITYAFDQPLALPRSSPQSESRPDSERRPESESIASTRCIASSRSTPLLSDMHMEAGLVLEGVERACSAVMRVGPSIVCAAAAECAAFLIGATTGPPPCPSFVSNIDFLCLVLVCLL